LGGINIEYTICYTGLTQREAAAKIGDISGGVVSRQMRKMRELLENERRERREEKRFYRQTREKPEPALHYSWENSD